MAIRPIWRFERSPARGWSPRSLSLGKGAEAPYMHLHGRLASRLAKLGRWSRCGRAPFALPPRPPGGRGGPFSLAPAVSPPPCLPLSLGRAGRRGALHLHPWSAWVALVERFSLVSSLRAEPAGHQARLLLQAAGRTADFDFAFSRMSSNRIWVDFKIS